MASSLHQWELDPLFSAAEVVQDSADRMESLFRLLLHQKSLVQGDHPDTRLLTSIEYHKRDLSTILETAKWQLEDFERAVSSSAIADTSQSREDVIFRHRQFIRAIREQINHVEKSVEGPLTEDSIRSSEWVNLNEHDRDVLASFLTGGNPTESLNHYDVVDSNILRRFLDPTSASSPKNDEIVEHDSREFEKVKMNGDIHADCYLDHSKDDNLSKVGSHWDLEANEAKHKSFVQDNKLRGFYSRMNFFGFLNNILTACRSKATRDYTKRLKDGEEQRHSPRYVDVSHSAQGQSMGPMLGSGCGSFQGLCSRCQANVMNLGSRLGAEYQRFHHHIQVNRHSLQIIFTTIFTLIFLGILVSRIA